MNGLTQLLSQSDKLVRTKKCSKCGEVKPLTDFYKDKTSKGGHHLHCMNCILSSINKKGRTEKGFLRKRYNNVSQAHKRKDKQSLPSYQTYQKEHQCYFTFEEFCGAFEKHKEKFGMRSAWGPHHLPITMIHQGRRHQGRRGGKKGQLSIGSNLSPDRLDSSKPYTIQNLIFIRNDENSRKKNTTYEDCVAQIKLHEERFRK